MDPFQLGHFRTVSLPIRYAASHSLTSFFTVTGPKSGKNMGVWPRSGLVSMLVI